MSDIRQLLQSMERQAGMGADAPEELRAGIQRVARRRRATREVAGGSLAVVAVGVVTFGAVKVLGVRDVEPAMPSLSPSPTDSPSISPSAVPEPSEMAESDWDPWSVYVRPDVVPATQEAADAALNPTAGPTLSIGVLEPATSFPGWEDAGCATSSRACVRIDAPPVTRAVLDQVTPAWEVVVDQVFLSGGSGSPLSSLYLASPQGDMYTLLDTSALGEQLGIGDGDTSDVALDAEAGTMIVAVQPFSGSPETVAFVDLETGQTQRLADLDRNTLSVERDGDNWLIWGTKDSTPFAARLAPDAQSWNVDDMWAVKDGKVERAGGHLVVRSDDGFLLAPDPVSFINLTAPRTEGEQCTVARATKDGLLTLCADQDGPAPATFVKWDGSQLAAPDVPQMPDVPLKRWAFALGDGYLEITPSAFGDNAPVADGTPDYEWHRPGGTEVIDGPASGGARRSSEDGAAVWLRQGESMSVIDSAGTWHDLVDWSDSLGHGYAHQPRFINFG